MYLVNQILTKFPKIKENDLYELLNIIDQSKEFGNFNNGKMPDNKFELDYAAYLGNRNEEFLAEYKQIVLECCYREFMEWYEYLTKHILRQDVQTILGISFSVSDNNWVEEFKKSDLIGWAFHLNNLDTFLENIEKVQALGDIMVNFFNDRKPLSILDTDYFESNHAQLVLDSINKILINNDRQELLHQLNSDKIICMIEVYGWENRFNPILLEWICNNRKRVIQWI